MKVKCRILVLLRSGDVVGRDVVMPFQPMAGQTLELPVKKERQLELFAVSAVVSWAEGEDFMTLRCRYAGKMSEDEFLAALNDHSVRVDGWMGYTGTTRIV